MKSLKRLSDHGQNGKDHLCLPFMGCMVLGALRSHLHSKFLTALGVGVINVFHQGSEVLKDLPKLDNAWDWTLDPHLSACSFDQMQSLFSFPRR